MADANPSTTRPTPQRLSSAPKSRTHQRKPSINIASNHLYAIPEKKTHPITPPPVNIPLSPAFIADPTSSSSLAAGMFPPSSPKRLRGGVSSWRRILHRITMAFDSLTDSSAGPILPHDKANLPFGGPLKRSRWSAILGMRWFRLLILIYIVVSVFLSASHMLQWLVSGPSQSASQFGVDWKPQRTYDQDQSYSLIDQMTHAHKMSKLFSKSSYEVVKDARPYWLKASITPPEKSITLVTTVTPLTWQSLIRLAKYWNGPISATLHLDQSEHTPEKLATFMSEYRADPNLAQHVDVHLLVVPGPALSVLLPRNAEQNLARLFSRTEYVCQVPTNVIPITSLARTFEANLDSFETLLQEGDMLVVPQFGTRQTDVTTYTLPTNKPRLLELVAEHRMELMDGPWENNEGPTGLERWKESQTLYSVEDYDRHYEPMVIESKTAHPWCTERFLDNRPACLLTNYLAGGEFWVLPDDFMIRLPEERQYVLSDFDSVIEKRLYSKFFWEQCVHQARQLDALGHWKSPRSDHVRKLCSHVIQNWGKGLIGKPE